MDRVLHRLTCRALLINPLQIVQSQFASHVRHFVYPFIQLFDQCVKKVNRRDDIEYNYFLLNVSVSSEGKICVYCLTIFSLQMDRFTFLLEKYKSKEQDLFKSIQEFARSIKEDRSFSYYPINFFKNKVSLSWYDYVVGLLNTGFCFFNPPVKWYSNLPTFFEQFTHVYHFYETFPALYFEKLVQSDFHLKCIDIKNLTCSFDQLIKFDGVSENLIKLISKSIPLYNNDEDGFNAWGTKLLSLFSSCDDFRSYLSRSPDLLVTMLFKFSEIEHDELDDSGVLYKNWVNLFEYLLNKQHLSKEDLEKIKWNDYLIGEVFYKLGTASASNTIQTAKFAQRLVPIATKLVKTLDENWNWEESFNWLRKAYNLLLDAGWNPKYEKEFSWNDLLKVSLLKFYRKSMPLLNGHAYGWMESITASLLCMGFNEKLLDAEDQEAYFLLFKQIHIEQQYPLFNSITIHYYVNLCVYPIILNRLIKEFPISLCHKHNSTSLGVALADAIVGKKNAPIESSEWIHSTLLLLNSINLELMGLDNDVSWHFDQVKTMMAENKPLIQSLLHASCVLSQKGKVKFIYSQAAGLLAWTCLEKVAELSSEDIKICAAILLDQSVLNLSESIIPPLSNHLDAIGYAMLERIVEHSLLAEGMKLQLHCIPIETAARRFVSECKNVSSFIRNFLPVASKNNFHFEKIVPLFTSLMTVEANCVMITETVCDLIKGSNKMFNYNYTILMELVEKIPELTKEAQKNVFGIWEKHPEVFVCNHLHLGKKIIKHVVNNPFHFRYRQNEIDAFLITFVSNFGNQITIKELFSIIPFATVPIARELLQTLNKYFKRHLKHILGRDLTEKERLWLEEADLNNHITMVDGW